MAQYTMMVAGFDYRQKELASLMSETNYCYDLSKAEMIDDFLVEEDERIYKFEKATYHLRIKHEPDNPHDPAALRVYADQTFIGYVPRGNLGILKKLASFPDLRMSVQIFGGPYKVLEYDDEEDYLGEMLPKYYRVRSEKDPFKAVMIFDYNNQ